MTSCAVPVIAACGDPVNPGQVDAPPDADGRPPDGAPPDGRPRAASTVFLNFDGATMTSGFPDDPAANVSVFIRTGGATVPPWRDGQVGSEASVAAIAAGVRQVLAPYDLDVVTSRPEMGPYEMIMFGGDGRALFGFGPVDLMGRGDCVDGPDISYVTEAVLDDEVAANLAIGALAEARFIPLTTARGDCLCFMTDHCLPHTGEPCTIGGVGTPTLPVGEGCAGLRPVPPPTIDEHAYFVDRFGAR